MKQPQFSNHLEGLAQAGIYKSLHFLYGETVNISRFSAYFPKYLLSRLQTVPDYHLFWFVTKFGVYVAVAGDRRVHGMLKQYIPHAISKGSIEYALESYSGRSQAKFSVDLSEALEKFVQIPNKRSFGGSLLI